MTPHFRSKLRTLSILALLLASPLAGCGKTRDDGGAASGGSGETGGEATGGRGGDGSGSEEASGASDSGGGAGGIPCAPEDLDPVVHAAISAEKGRGGALVAEDLALVESLELEAPFAFESLDCLPQLSDLALDGPIPISSSDLSHCSGLTSLAVFDTGAFDAEVLAPLPGLEQLVLGDVGSGSLDALLSSCSLRTIRITNFQLEDASPLGACSDLEEFSLAESPVSDLSFLAKLSALGGVSIHDVPVADLSSLSVLPALSRVSVSKTLILEIPRLSPAAGGAGEATFSENLLDPGLAPSQAQAACDGGWCIEWSGADYSGSCPQDCRSGK